MSHYRYDQAHKMWVIFAPERGMRPTDYRNPNPPQVEGVCPFCYGNEKETPPELFAFRIPGSEKDKPGWNTRVFRNKFPALTRSPASTPNDSLNSDLTMPGFGKHEVIVETPGHNIDFPEMELEHIELIFKTYINRFEEYVKDQDYKYTLIFRNYGYHAGATFSHPHSQLIALPLVPSTIEVEHQAAKEYFSQKGNCWLCDSVNGELSDDERVIYSHGNIVAYTPFAPRLPYEFNITTRSHSQFFHKIDKADINSLAIVLKYCITRLKKLFPDICYNYLLHTIPEFTQEMKKESAAYNHWHFEIIPRLVKTAGFEIGAGFSINHTLPEKAAELLRTA